MTQSQVLISESLNAFHKCHKNVWMNCWIDGWTFSWQLKGVHKNFLTFEFSKFKINIIIYFIIRCRKMNVLMCFFKTLSRLHGPICFTSVSVLVRIISDGLDLVTWNYMLVKLCRLWLILRNQTRHTLGTSELQFVNSSKTDDDIALLFNFLCNKPKTNLGYPFWTF